MLLRSDLSSPDICICCCACVQSSLTLHDPWTIAHQAPLSMGFPRQEYWNGLPFPPPGDLPNPGIELTSLVSPASAGRFFTTMPPYVCIYKYIHIYIYILHVHTAIFIYFWLHWVFTAACGPSLDVASRGYSLIAERGLLIVVASLVPEHRL